MSKRPAKQFMDQARKLREAGEGLSYARTFDFAVALERGESTDTIAPAPAEISPEEAMPQSDAPESFNFSEALRSTAQQAAQYQQRGQLDERFEALGLGSMKGSQIDSGFMGRLVGEFKSAKDKGVLDVLESARRREKAIQDEKTKEQDFAISMIDNLIDRGALNNLEGSVLRDYEEKAGYPVGYLSALKEAETELEAAKKAKDDQATRKAEANLLSIKASTQGILADTAATRAETRDTYGVQSKTGYVIDSNGSFTFNNPLPGRVECGEYTNDSQGTPNAFGDTFKSKKRNTPSATPYTGGTFSVNIGTNGHCGNVEAVYADGSILIADVNRNGKREGIVTRDIIKPNEQGQYIFPGYTIPIAGFGKPSISMGEEMTKDQLESLNSYYGELGKAISSGEIKTRGDALAFLDLIKTLATATLGETGFTKLEQEVDRLFPPAPGEAKAVEYTIGAPKTGISASGFSGDISKSLSGATPLLSGVGIGETEAKGLSTTAPEKEAESFFGSLFS